jgi:hypothetical protein
MSKIALQDNERIDVVQNSGYLYHDSMAFDKLCEDA